jgi:signal transduction histidine kinase
MAGLLLGGWGVFGFLLFTCAVNGLMSYAEIHQWYTVTLTHDVWQLWVLQVVTFSAGAALLWFANRLILESFERARRENIERCSAEQKVNQLNVELEQKLREHMQLIVELEAKNAELERFVYTVSHDLKSPLVTINGFLGYLQRDAMSGNMERMRTDLERITDATDKMQRLLNELLELSRIGRMMNPPEEAPFGEIVNEAVALVHGQIEARGVEVQIAPDLRLVEVVQNLLDNAVKFMGEQSHPRIEIGMRGADAHRAPVFYVRDNGVGIEPQYHEKVFGLFNKLDPHTDGTGVGLALVKRIVEVHGGRIWIESEGGGQGTTFCFIIAPKPEKPEQPWRMQ